MRKTLREFLQTALLSLLVFVSLQLTIQNFRVEGSSMQQTLQSGQYLLVNKLVYFRVNMNTIAKVLPFVKSNGEEKFLFHPPRRGEVIVFHYPIDPARDFVKRVIGVPGDVVAIKNGSNIYVNGQLVKEPYAVSCPNTLSGCPDMRVALGADQYFVMGDNRPNSNDSRSWGEVSLNYIIGKAWVAYWPFSQWKFF